MHMSRQWVPRPTAGRWLPTTVVVAAASLAASVAGAQNGDVRRGALLFESGDYAAAKAALSGCGEPRGAAACYYLGRIAVVEDRPEEAVRLLERAIKAAGDVADYHTWLGVALGLQARASGRFRQAMLASRAKGEFERAVQLDPRNVGAREGLVQFYSIAPGIAGGSMRRAREHAAAIGRVSAMRGYIATGTILEREKDVAGAEREYRAASAAAPDSAAPY